MERRPLEPGLMLFIKKKLENLIPLKEVKEMLLRAGFTDKQIDEAVREVSDRYPDTHQDIVAGNSFLPPLKEKTPAQQTQTPAAPSVLFPSAQRKIIKEIKEIKEMKKTGETVLSTNPRGFFSGRLRRRDFIISFLFFFGMGAVITATILGVFSFIYPNFITFTDDLVSNGFYGLWAFLIPLMVAPLSLMLLSICARRFHDLSLPGALALGFLIFFVNPTNSFVSYYGIIALQGMMLVLLLLLITKKGESSANKFGDAPSMKGSTFSRVFNSSSSE